MKKALQSIALILCLCFSLSASAAITVTYPNGGEILLVGQTYKITWTGGGNGNAAVTYSYDGGSNWTYIGTTSAISGFYNWLVPNTPSNKCLVRVAEGSTSFDQSDNMFTIMSGSTGIGNVADVSGKNLVVYPNPASVNLNIVVPGSQVVQTVKVYNMLGSLVKEFRFEDGTQLPIANIPVAELPEGQYFVEVKTNVAVATEKITVMK